MKLKLIAVVALMATTSIFAVRSSARASAPAASPEVNYGTPTWVQKPSGTPTTTKASVTQPTPFAVSPVAPATSPTIVPRTGNIQPQFIPAQTATPRAPSATSVSTPTHQMVSPQAVPIQTNAPVNVTTVHPMVSPEIAKPISGAPVNVAPMRPIRATTPVTASGWQRINPRANASTSPWQRSSNSNGIPWWGQ